MARTPAHPAPLALAALLVTACGGGAAEMPRAHAPSAPDEAARCSLAARNESPLVTEWSSAEKANLQARLRSGAMAVEFTGCSMRPILGCNLRGSYRWQRTTLASESIEIHNQDELFAKLPLGAISLEGELARSGRLAVRTSVSGQYVLEGSSVADVPDYGDCQAATHLLVGMSIGSFKLHSGGTLQAGGSREAGAIQGGAQTSSSESLLREAGDFDSCKASTDEQPELNCSSPIQAFLQPLPRFSKERGSGTLRVTFAVGDSDRSWELRKDQQFVCRAPCTRWVNPSENYQLRTETGPDFQTVDVPDLTRFASSGALEVRAYQRKTGTFATGVALAGSGGALAFMGGFLALFGGMADRSGLQVGGAVTAGVGVALIAPGIYLTVTSGSRTEVRTDRGVEQLELHAPSVMGLGGTF